MPSENTKIKLSREQLLDALCRICTDPDNPKMCCADRRDGIYCDKALRAGLLVCKNSSLENEVIFQGY
jgi:hypothetical protein